MRVFAIVCACLCVYRSVGVTLAFEWGEHASKYKKGLQVISSVLLHLVVMVMVVMIVRMTVVVVIVVVGGSSSSGGGGVSSSSSTGVIND